MAREIKLTSSGEPDGRGRSEGSKTHQFKSGGHAGPGRPKGSVNVRTAYMTAAAIPVSVTIKKGNGKPKKRLISTLDAMVLKQRQKGLDGDWRANEKFIARIAEFSPVEIPVDLRAEIRAEDDRLLADALARIAAGARSDGDD